MVDVRIKNIEESDADTLLSEDMSFQGTMSLSRPAMIKGQLASYIKTFFCYSFIKSWCRS